MIFSKQNVIYSLRNIKSRKARSILTILSILIGITTIFIFVSFGWGLLDYVNEVSTSTGADKFLVEGKTFGAPGTSSFILDDSDLRTIEKTRGVFEVTPLYLEAAQIKQKKKVKYIYLLGVDPDSTVFTELMSVNIEKGRALKSGDKGKVVLGHNYQLENSIFEKPYSLNSKIEINGKKFTVVGFYSLIGNPGDDSNIYLPLDEFEDFLSPKTYGLFVGRANLEEMDLVINRVKKELRKNRFEDEGRETFKVNSFQSQIESIRSVFNFVIAFIIIIAFISIIVAAVNTANTMVTSVLERVKEIGIIKSIGAKNSEIFAIFLFESSFLGFISGILGVSLGFIFTSLATKILMNFGFGFLKPHYSILLFLGCILFSTSIGAISGVLPALDASKKHPVEALRFE